MKIRKAFVMSVNAGAEEEYEKRHQPIWPELAREANIDWRGTTREMSKLKI
jgi:L-rhamnose mutarotase